MKLFSINEVLSVSFAFNDDQTVSFLNSVSFFCRLAFLALEIAKFSGKTSALKIIQNWIIQLSLPSESAAADLELDSSRRAEKSFPASAKNRRLIIVCYVWVISILSFHLATVI